MFSKELELTVSSESIRQYKEIAYRHLQDQNSAFHVAVAGVDEEGNEIFGIVLVSNDGEKNWYDPEGLDTLMGWDAEEDAYTELEDKVLPQIGYALFQKDLELFHKSMGKM